MTPIRHQGVRSSLKLMQCHTVHAILPVRKKESIPQKQSRTLCIGGRGKENNIIKDLMTLRCSKKVKTYCIMTRGKNIGYLVLLLKNSMIEVIS